MVDAPSQKRSPAMRARRNSTPAAKQDPEAHLRADVALWHELARGMPLPDRFRTAMCRHMQQEGSCAFGAKCIFAHTPDELRTVEQNHRDGFPPRARGTARRAANAARANDADTAEQVPEGPSNGKTTPLLTRSQTPAAVTPASAPRSTATPVRVDGACGLLARGAIPARRYQHQPYAARPISTSPASDSESASYQFK